MRRSQWPRVLRRRFVAARLLRLWVRFPPGAWKSVCCECCVLSGIGLCDGLITRPEESYRMWCVVVCDLQTSWMSRPWPTGGLLRQKQKQKINMTHNECYLYKTLNYKSRNCDIQGFHRLDASLVSRFYDFKTANQRNIPEDASLYLFHIGRNARFSSGMCLLFLYTVAVCMLRQMAPKTRLAHKHETPSSGTGVASLTFRHRASCILGQAFRYSPENAFYIFNQQIYFIIWYLLDRASLI